MNFITYNDYIFYVRALQTKFQSGTLPNGIEPSGMILCNIKFLASETTKDRQSNETPQRITFIFSL